MGGMLLPISLIFVIFWLFIIRPQSKREKKRKAMIAAVSKGNRIVSAGGIHGQVLKVDETSVLVEVDSNVKLRIEKNSLANVVDGSGTKV